MGVTFGPNPAIVNPSSIILAREYTPGPNPAVRKEKVCFKGKI